MRRRNTSKAAIQLAGICLFVIGLPLAYSHESGEILTANPNLYEFGIIDEGQPAVITVVIRNVGSAPVEITNVRTS
jgi:hypothetical protein